MGESKGNEVEKSALKSSHISFRFPTPLRSPLRRLVVSPARWLFQTPTPPHSHTLSRPLSLSPSRAALLTLGVLTLAAAWLGPLPQLAQQAFYAHMTLHMGVVAVAAPLLALGLAGSSLDPVRKAAWFFAPVPASVLELLVVWGWHAPVLHHAARHSTTGFILEQGTFLLSGLLVWLSAFGGGSARRGERTGAGVIGLLLTSMHMTLLGALLGLTPRPLYHHTEGFSGLTPLEDQHLGGAIMLLVGGISYLAGGLWLTAGLVRGAVRKAEERT
jgi:putative membrane protein